MTQPGTEERLQALYAAYHEAQARHWSTSQLITHRRYADGRPVTRADLEDALWRERLEWTMVTKAAAAYHALTLQNRPMQWCGSGGAIPAPV